jgi:hypothetical protein
VGTSFVDKGRCQPVRHRRSGGVEMAKGRARSCSCTRFSFGGYMSRIRPISSASSFTVRLEADTQAGAGGFRKPLERAR